MSNMIKKPLQYLVISDVHLYHPKTTTYEIIDHLDNFFQYYKPGTDFTNIDILFIAGDLFDGLTDFSNRDSHLVNLWLSRLLTFCSTFNIKLRVLEGTPSHDWHQSKIIDIIIKVMSINIDYKYIDVLCIEHIEDLGLSILYLPDEWTTSAAITQDQVQKLLNEEGISQVDIAIMHGMFTYQLVNVPNQKHCHSESYYLSIVKYVISIGHIHTHSVYERIIAQGSFDRLRHGEEEPKGAVLISLYPDGSYKYLFIQNKLAKIYKTIVFRSNDLQESSDRLVKILKKLPDESHIRIKASKDHPFFVGLDTLKSQYINFNFTRLAIGKEDVQQQYLNTEILPIDYEPLALTEDNLVMLLWQQIDSKYVLTEFEKNELKSILETC